MTQAPKPPRQPLFWAAVVLTLGLWTGIRAWRPPLWWAIAIAVFVLAALWFLSRRPWLAKTLALATWFLFGALLIQIRGRPLEDPRLLALSDGGPVTLIAHVIREGYAHAAGPWSVRQSVDVETEAIERGGQSWPVRAGIRLSLYERVESPVVSIPPFANNAKGGAASDSASPNSSPPDPAPPNSATSNAAAVAAKDISAASASITPA